MCFIIFFVLGSIIKVIVSIILFVSKVQTEKFLFSIALYMSRGQIMLELVLIGYLYIAESLYLYNTFAKSLYLYNNSFY